MYFAHLGRDCSKKQENNTFATNPISNFTCALEKFQIVADKICVQIRSEHSKRETNFFLDVASVARSKNNNHTLKLRDICQYGVSTISI